MDEFADERKQKNNSISSKSPKDKIIGEKPAYYDYLLVLSCTLVPNELRLIDAVTCIFDVVLDDADSYNTDQEHVFVIGINYEDETLHVNSQKVYNKLTKYFNKALVNGFIDIRIYRYPSFFCHPDNHIEVEECVYQETVSQNMPLQKSIVSAIMSIKGIGHVEPSILKIDSKVLHCL